MKNFHLPLPEKIWNDLHAEAKRTQVPATTIAREAISDWLRARKQLARRDAIMGYASAMAGTRFDLDLVLESAAIEELTKNR